ncbi:MAG: TM2 domain-containing protein [Polyangiaceae bacterium]|nr:TM2 domain-containing protein [Polyangiaceae bacterium]
MSNNTHSLTLGYVLWILGFTGAHRFYFGRPVTGTVWFFTGGLCGVGWFVDLFLMPRLDNGADRRFRAGKYDYSVAWILLTFFGYLGIHRFYLGRWLSGVVWLLTGGLFLVGYLFDLWTLNDQIHEANGGD